MISQAQTGVFLHLDEDITRLNLTFGCLYSIVISALVSLSNSSSFCDCPRHNLIHNKQYFHHFRQFDLDLSR